MVFRVFSPLMQMKRHLVDARRPNKREREREREKDTFEPRTVITQE
jgi:hypothetical protein